MKYDRTDEIFVRIVKVGFIPQLGMCGPIPNAIKITRGLAHSMIVSGIKVYEFTPETKDIKELTLQNVFGEEEVQETKNPKTPKTPDPIKPVKLDGVKKPEISSEAKKTVKEAVAPVKLDEVKPEEDTLTPGETPNAEEIKPEDDSKDTEEKKETYNDNNNYYNKKNKKNKK